MTDSAPTTSRRLSRRTLIGLAAAAAVVSPAAAKDHPSMAAMRQAAKDLLNANRLGTVASFKRAILRHADVADIGLYSLGQYKSKLTTGLRDPYFGGVALFMARYFADQSREYRVAKYELGEATVASDKDIQIGSKVYLLSGNTYTVVWRLAWRGGRYKLVDAKVLGFSLVYLQRGLFTSYLSKRNGDIGQLVAALNR